MQSLINKASDSQEMLEILHYAKVTLKFLTEASARLEKKSMQFLESDPADITSSLKYIKKALEVHRHAINLDKAIKRASFYYKLLLIKSERAVKKHFNEIFIKHYPEQLAYHIDELISFLIKEQRKLNNKVQKLYNMNDSSYIAYKSKSNILFDLTVNMRTLKLMLLKLYESFYEYNPDACQPLIFGRKYQIWIKHKLNNPYNAHAVISTRYPDGWYFHVSKNKKFTGDQVSKYISSDNKEINAWPDTPIDKRTKYDMLEMLASTVHSRTDS